MQRFIPALLTSLIACGTASAGPLALTPDPYPSTSTYASSRPALLLPFVAPSAAPAPVQTAAVERPVLGGGFLEFLFRGGNSHAAQPRYAPADQGQYASAPAGVQPEIDPRFLPQEVVYAGREAPGTVVVNTRERMLYLVKGDGRAMRYGIGVGRPGFTWAGTHQVSSKREWPDWRPPDDMLRRRPDLPRYMPGGPDNPLGARAMYLGSTLYRIHGSNEPWTIGTAVSSGCIRMRNEDVIDLYGKVKVGTKVVVI